MKFDYKLTVNAHIDDICKKIKAEVKCLIKNSNIHGLFRKRLLVNVFLMSQFNYLPLIWMCHKKIKNHTKNNKINRIHERCLRKCPGKA